MFYTIYNCIDTILIDASPITGNTLLLTYEQVVIDFLQGAFVFGIIVLCCFYMDAEEGPLDKLKRFLQEADKKTNIEGNNDDRN